MNEHQQKYDDLAHRLGWDEIKALVPFQLEHVRKALEAGDEHLNTLTLAVWDRAALGVWQARTCKECGAKLTYKKPAHGCGGHLASLFKGIGRGHSLSDGVCLLKHVAKVEAGEMLHHL